MGTVCAVSRPVGNALRSVGNALRGVLEMSTVVPTEMDEVLSSKRFCYPRSG